MHGKVAIVCHLSPVGPEKIKEGTESDQLILERIFLATLAAINNKRIQEGQARDSVNVLPALTDNPTEPIREHLLLAAKDRSHLSIRKGKWMFIDAQAGGGFNAAKRGAHAFGGPKAITFVGRQNSDIADGKIKTGAPPAQLYNLASDLEQTTNLYFPLHKSEKPRNQQILSP